GRPRATQRHDRERDPASGVATAGHRVAAADAGRKCTASPVGQRARGGAAQTASATGEAPARVATGHHAACPLASIRNGRATAYRRARTAGPSATVAAGGNASDAITAGAGS